MPKCLDCNNITRFSYMEDSYNESSYDENGEMQDNYYKQYSDPREGTCLECQSTNIEGNL